MRTRIAIGCVIVAGLSMLINSGLWAAQDAAAGDAPAQDARPQPRGGGMGGPGMMGMPFARDPYAETIVILGELNLTPAFTLTQEQKEKLQTIRNDVRKAQQQWRETHAAELNQLQESAREARQGGNREKMRELMQKRQQLLATMPMNDEALKQVRALLTEDQLKALDQRLAQRRPGMRGPAQGGPRGRAGQAPAEAPKAGE